MPREPLSPTPSPTPEQQLLVQKLARMRRLPLGRVVCAVPAAPLSPADAVGPGLRINTVLSGRKKIALPLAAGTTELEFRPGDVQYSPPGTWEGQTWDRPHELLCLVPHPTYLRVSYYRVTKGRGVENTFYHTTRAPSEAFRRMLDLFAALGPAVVKTPELYPALAALARAEVEPPPATVRDRAARSYERVLQYLDNTFHEGITRASVARALDLSPAYISHLFKAQGGTSFTRCLTEKRLAYARQLLRGTDLPVAQVGRQSGFRDPVHFGRAFRLRCGLPPGAYRLAAQQDRAERE